MKKHTKDILISKSMVLSGTVAGVKTENLYKRVGQIMYNLN